MHDAGVRPTAREWGRLPHTLTQALALVPRWRAEVEKEAAERQRSK